MFTILFIGGTYNDAAHALNSFRKYSGKVSRGILLFDTNKPTPASKDPNLTIHPYNFRTQQEAAQDFVKSRERIDIVTCTKESAIPLFSYLIPTLSAKNPNLRLPTVKSLLNASDKHHMRAAFAASAPHTTPQAIMVDPYQPLHNFDELQKLEFPVMIKPANQASSLFVTKCTDPKLFKDTLVRVAKEVTAANDRNHPERKAKLVVEEYLEGPMYSVDAYVNDTGHIWYCPLVKVITGHDLGEDDFYGFAQITPADVTELATKAAQTVAGDGIKALGLINVSCHVELKKTPHGWKIIEIGPRVGGFRQYLYHTSFSIDHLLNDLLIRCGDKPIVSKEVLRAAAKLKLYPQKAGTLVTVEGLEGITTLSSTAGHRLEKHPGDRVKRAVDGGMCTLVINLENPSRADLLKDIGTVRQSVKIVTKP